MSTVSALLLGLGVVVAVLGALTLWLAHSEK